VLTHDADAAWRVARAMRTGCVGQNGMRADFSLPFGGFKRSGIGREGRVEGLDQLYRAENGAARRGARHHGARSDNMPRSAEEEARRRFVLEMYRNVLIAMDSAAVDRYIAPDYIQHSGLPSPAPPASRPGSTM
jgi:hypothetical protein